MGCVPKAQIFFYSFAMERSIHNPHEVGVDEPMWRHRMADLQRMMYDGSIMTPEQYEELRALYARTDPVPRGT
jgi:hypothetical protein